MRPSFSRGLRAAALCAFAVGMALPRPALAQEPSKADLAKARIKFQEAVALAAANNCAAALVKYKEVAEVKMSPQVAFNTAECEARLGKLVSALGNYRVAAAKAQDDKRAAAVLREAPSRIDDLDARIPKLTITRGKGADTAAIELDGTEIGQTQLGNAIPVDPGTHTIVARVNGKEYLHQTIKLDEKDSKTFDVKISVAPPKVEPPAPEPTPEPPKPPEPKSKVPGAVVVAGGGALMIVGLAMLGPRASALGKLQMDCNAQNQCPPSDQSTGDSGRLYTGLTEVLVPLGVVGVAAGVVMLIKAGSPSADKKPDEKKESDEKKEDAFWRSIHVVPSAAGANVGGLSLVGRF